MGRKVYKTFQKRETSITLDMGKGIFKNINFISNVHGDDRTQGEYGTDDLTEQRLLEASPLFNRKFYLAESEEEPKTEVKIVEAVEDPVIADIYYTSRQDLYDQLMAKGVEVSKTMSINTMIARAQIKGIKAAQKK